MATSTSLLSEEKFLCSVCLEVFTEPVSTPCGHNFCSGCINKFWDCTDICQCPLCNRPFSTRPELHINTIMSELAAEFKKSVQVQASIPDSDVPETADVPCDICFEVKDKAVKSCLVCLASFCKTHLEPHERVAGLQGHTLINPVKKLEDKMCKMHNKLTELYCRTDQVCICVLCIKATHKSHNVVPLEEEYESVMARKDDAVGDIQKMIQSRSEKIAEIEKGLDDSEKEAAKEKEATVQVFTDFIQLVQRGQSELVEVIEERYSATKKKGKGFLKELRMEVEELDSRSSQLQKLSLSEDHHHFLQKFPALSCPLNTDWTDAAVNSDLCFETVREAVTLLQEKVDEITAKVPEIKMRRMREHAVDLTFDPDTAHSLLVISHDGKQVTRVNEEQNLPGNSKRSEYFSEVLAKEGFTSGKFYYEVQVTGRDNWHVGARESRERNSSAITVRNGFWVIGTSKDGIFRAYTTPVTKITKIDNIQKVGVYVDYDKRVISFYNVESKSHMYSFTGCSFTKRLFPCFYLNDVEENAPIIITPVPKND